MGGARHREILVDEHFDARVCGLQGASRGRSARLQDNDPVTGGGVGGEAGAAVDGQAQVAGDLARCSGREDQYQPDQAAPPAAGAGAPAILAPSQTHAQSSHNGSATNPAQPQATAAADDAEPGSLQALRRYAVYPAPYREDLRPAVMGDGL
jgi:hypothetical protein